MGKKRSIGSIFGDKFKQLDQFGHEFRMNMRGDTSINSVYGAFISVLLVLVLFGYSAVRIEALQSKRDTIRSDIVAEDFIDETTEFNFKENNFHLAFAVESYVDRTGKDDPDYAEWLVMLYRSTNGQESQTVLR
jgi:hypothetical protein